MKDIKNMNIKRKLGIVLGVITFFVTFVYYVPVNTMGEVRIKRKALKTAIDKGIEDIKTKQSIADLQELHKKTVEQAEKIIKKGEIPLSPKTIKSEMKRLNNAFELAKLKTRAAVVPAIQTPPSAPSTIQTQPTAPPAIQTPPTPAPIIQTPTAPPAIQTPTALILEPTQTVNEALEAISEAQDDLENLEDFKQTAKTRQITDQEKQEIDLAYQQAKAKLESVTNEATKERAQNLLNDLEFLYKKIQENMKNFREKATILYQKAEDLDKKYQTAQTIDEINALNNKQTAILNEFSSITTGRMTSIYWKLCYEIEKNLAYARILYKDSEESPEAMLTRIQKLHEYLKNAYTAVYKIEETTFSMIPKKQINKKITDKTIRAEGVRIMGYQNAKSNAEKITKNIKSQNEANIAKKLIENTAKEIRKSNTDFGKEIADEMIASITNYFNVQKEWEKKLDERLGKLFADMLKIHDSFQKINHFDNQADGIIFDEKEKAKTLNIEKYFYISTLQTHMNKKNEIYNYKIIQLQLVPEAIQTDDLVKVYSNINDAKLILKNRITNEEIKNLAIIEIEKINNWIDELEKRQEKEGEVEF